MVINDALSGEEHKKDPPEPVITEPDVIEPVVSDSVIPIDTVEERDIVTPMFLLSNEGTCTTCNCECKDDSIIECNKCNLKFHALCNIATPLNCICNKSFLNLFKQRSTRKNFIWCCDCCMTTMEINSVKTDNQRITQLEEKNR